MVVRSNRYMKSMTKMRCGLGGNGGGRLWAEGGYDMWGREKADEETDKGIRPHVKRN